MKEKITHIITSLTANGAESLVVELLCRLKNIGIDCELISLFPAKFGELEIKLKKSGIEYYCLNQKNWKSLKTLWLLRKKIIASNPSIIHSHLFPASYLSVFAKRKKCRLVTTEHSFLTRRRKIPAIKYIEQKIYNKYDRIVCISNDVFDKMNCWMPMLKKKIKLIENGIDLKRFIINKNGNYKKKYGFPQDKILVGMVGRFEQPPKDQKTLVKAFARISDVHLVLIGDGPERKKIELLVQENSVEERVHFTGYINNVAEVYTCLNIYVQSSYHEGFGLSVIEAMATGIPVIVTDVNALNQIVTNEIDGLIFELGNVKMLDYYMMRS